MPAKHALVEEFDGLMQCAKVLAVGIEPEFQAFCEYQKVCRRQWASAEAEIPKLQGRMTELETENKTLDVKLKHARNLVVKEEQKRSRVEHEKEQLERQVALIRELLVDQKTSSKLDDHDRERLAFLSNTTYGGSDQKSAYEESHKRLSRVNESQHSILSDEDVDYWDKTEEDLDTPCGRLRRSKRLKKRPSAPPEEALDITPPKRQKPVSMEENVVVTNTTITVTADGRPIEATTEVTVPHGGTKTLNKSFSEPNLDKYSETESSDMDPWTPMRRDQNDNASSKSVLRGTPRTPMMRKAHSAKGLNRIHFFVSETVIRPRTCNPCGKKIGFGRMAMKCKECRSMCHPECKDNLPLPCIHAPPTPGTGKINGQGVLADYCNDEAPRIPGLVIHCVNEVEDRGLTEVGLYRVPGSDRQIKELKEKFFKGKGMPNLSNIDDIHVICGCLKDFLRHLKEPLVTFGLWKDFVKAAENRDRAMRESEMYQALSQLPQANRDTIAFVMLHLLKVSQTPVCKMPPNNLARVFGPTLVGHAIPEPEPMQLINDTKYQALVMDRLFEIPEDYWFNFISHESENTYHGDMNSIQSPDQRGLLSSRLGPVVTPSSYERSHTWTSKNTYPRRESKRTGRLLPPLKELRRSMSESSV